MMFDRSRKYDSYQISGVLSNFSVAPDGIKVSIHTFHMFEPHESSWGTTVTLRTRRNSAAKETSLLTSSRFL